MLQLLQKSWLSCQVYECSSCMHAYFLLHGLLDRCPVIFLFNTYTDGALGVLFFFFFFFVLRYHWLYRCRMYRRLTFTRIEYLSRTLSSIQTDTMNLNLMYSVDLPQMATVHEISFCNSLISPSGMTALPTPFFTIPVQKADKEKKTKTKKK